MCKLLPPQNRSVVDVVREEGICEATLWDSLKPFKIRWIFQITVLSQ
jgi:hypothetical protein